VKNEEKNPGFLPEKALAFGLNTVSGTKKLCFLLVLPSSKAKSEFLNQRPLDNVHDSHRCRTPLTFCGCGREKGRKVSSASLNISLQKA